MADNIRKARKLIASTDQKKEPKITSESPPIKEPPVEDPPIVEKKPEIKKPPVEEELEISVEEIVSKINSAAQRLDVLEQDMQRLISVLKSMDERNSAFAQAINGVSQDVSRLYGDLIRISNTNDEVHAKIGEYVGEHADIINQIGSVVENMKKSLDETISSIPYIAKQVVDGDIQFEEEEESEVKE